MSPSIRAKNTLAQHPSIIAVIIAIILILWMFSGGQPTPTELVANGDTKVVTPKVQVTTMVAETVRNSMSLYGRSEPNRSVQLKAEVKGKIVAILVERGAPVVTGQVIAKIDDYDIKSQLERAKALLQQREIEYKGAKSLNRKGLQGDAQLAQSYANLAAANADITQLMKNLERTQIKAPFDGVLNERQIELGDYLKVGDQVAVIADLNPLVIRAFATEQQIGKLKVAQPVSVKLIDNSEHNGALRYIASVADAKTNTFKVEIALDNPQLKLAAGISGEATIALAEFEAIKLSPALLALDESGNIGVKSVNTDDKVVFTPIQIIKNESDGVWLAGLGASAKVITLGQGFVRAGDLVEAISDEQVKKLATAAQGN